MPNKLVMDVKKSKVWQRKYWNALGSDKLMAALPEPPRGRDLDRGVMTGSENYNMHTLCNELLFGYPDAEKNLLIFLNGMRIKGHCGMEQTTPSHMKEHYVPHSLILWYASYKNRDELLDAEVFWWQTEFAIIRKFLDLKHGVVCTGARGKRRKKPGQVGESGPAGNNVERDQIAKYVVSKNRESLPKDRGRHADQLIWTVLRAAPINRALIAPSSPVRLLYPIRIVGATSWLQPDCKLKDPQIVVAMDYDGPFYSLDRNDAVYLEDKYQDPEIFGAG